MGGREAIRGFSIQTLICLLDSLQSVNSSWVTVTIEPDSFNDKADISWEFSDGTRRLQQVKSSKNQIWRADVDFWCKELKLSGRAESYQLMLAGPIAAAVLDDAPFHGVDVPVPASLDTLALIDQAITRLDRYLIEKTIAPLPLSIRESLIYIVAARLLEGAVSGKKLHRNEFDGWLLHWITAAYPEAIEQRMSANCSVLWSSIEISSHIEISRRAFEVILPLTIVNGGVSTAVVEWFLLRVSSEGREMRYRPVLVMPEVGVGLLERRMMARPFGEFAVSPQAAVNTVLLFTPVDKNGYAVDEWPRGQHELELFIKYTTQPAPCLIKKVSILITMEETAVLGTTNTKHVSISTLESYLDII